MLRAIMKALSCAFVFLFASLAGQQAPVPTSPSSLEQLPHGFYFQLGHNCKKLEGVNSSGFATKHGGAAFAGVLPSGVRLYAGQASSSQFENPRPVFAIRLDPLRPDVPGFNVRDLLIIRMNKKKDHRELQVLKGGFASMQSGINSKDVIEVVVSPAGDHAFTVVPKADLDAGEYLISFRRADGNAGYDFTIKK